MGTLVAIGALAVVIGALLPLRRGQVRGEAAGLIIGGALLLAVALALRRVLV